MKHGKHSGGLTAACLGYCRSRGSTESIDTVLSRDTLTIVHNLGLSKAQMKDTTAIIEAMQTYVNSHINETAE